MSVNGLNKDMLTDKEYNPFKHIHNRIDLLERHLIEIKKRLDMPNNERNYTRKMIKETYHVSYGTIHNHMKNGNLKYFKMGAKTLFHFKEVDKWIKRIGLDRNE